MFQHKKSLWLFLLPGRVGVMVFYIVPFFGGMYYSFTDGSWENKFIWFDNYARVWGNSMFRLGLGNSMLLSVICPCSLQFIGISQTGHEPEQPGTCP